MLKWDRTVNITFFHAHHRNPLNLSAMLPIYLDDIFFFWSWRQKRNDIIFGHRIVLWNDFYDASKSLWHREIVWIFSIFFSCRCIIKCFIQLEIKMFTHQFIAFVWKLFVEWKNTQRDLSIFCQHLLGFIIWVIFKKNYLTQIIQTNGLQSRIHVNS